MKLGVMWNPGSCRAFCRGSPLPPTQKHHPRSSFTVFSGRKSLKSVGGRHRTQKAAVPPSVLKPLSPPRFCFPPQPSRLCRVPPSPLNPPYGSASSTQISLSLARSLSWIEGFGVQTLSRLPHGSRSGSTASWSPARLPASGTPGSAVPDRPDTSPYPASRPHRPALRPRRYLRQPRTTGFSLCLQSGPMARGSSSGGSSPPPPPSPSSLLPQARISPSPYRTPSASIWSPHVDGGSRSFPFLIQLFGSDIQSVRQIGTQ